MRYAYHGMLLWAEFVDEGMAVLSFSSRCISSIDEVSKLSYNIKELDNDLTFLTRSLESMRCLMLHTFDNTQSMLLGNPNVQTHWFKCFMLVIQFSSKSLVWILSNSFCIS